MEAKELRRGNYISRKDLGSSEERIETVLELYKDKLLTSGPLIVIVNYSEIQPIPLTEEWLLKGGFTLNENGFEYNDWTCLSIWQDKKSFYGFLADWSGKTIRHIKYVHQLQNLYFALTGEELILIKK